MNSIRKFMFKAGLSQADVARTLNVSPATVSRWGNGKFYPRKDKLVQLARVLHCTVDDLLKEDA